MLERNPLSTEHRAVAERLVILEKAVGWDGKQASQELEISDSSWSDYKTAKRKFPTHLARRLKGLHGVSLDWIYTGDEANNLPSFNEKLRGLRRQRA